MITAECLLLVFTGMVTPPRSGWARRFFGVAGRRPSVPAGPLPIPVEVAESGRADPGAANRSTFVPSLAVPPPTWLLGTMVLMFGLHCLAPVASLVTGPGRFAGLIPPGFGLGINLLADAALRKAKTPVKPHLKPQTLVTWGIFRVTRNPMYLGFVFVVFGVALLLGTVTPFLALPAFAGLLDRTFIRYEERVLAETFGGRWNEYQDRVRRWL